MIEGSNSFYDDVEYPEDSVSGSPKANTLTVSHKGQVHNLTVSSYDYDDSHAAKRSKFGTILELKDEQGRTVARYSPKNFMFMVAPEFRGQQWTDSIAPAFQLKVDSYLNDGAYHPVLDNTTRDRTTTLAPSTATYETAKPTPNPATVEVAAPAPSTSEQSVQPSQSAPKGKKARLLDRIRGTLGDSKADLKATISSFFGDKLTPRKGSTARVRTVQGTEANVQYRIVDADSLITSTKETGAPNPAYPQDMQPRQRDRAASLEQIERIAGRIDPELLAENALASDGAPIIGSDMAVESGNGRVMALRQAYKTGRAEGYRSWLKQNAGRFGLNETDFDRMTKPVLVRERISDVNRVQFAREANESSVSSMSSAENAMNDARLITPGFIRAYYNEGRTLAENREFIARFLSQLPANERAGFIQSDGRLSRAGYERVKNALAARAYGDASIINRLAENLDDNIRNVSNALIQAAPAVAMFETSDRRQELSLTEDIKQAVNLFAYLRENGQKVSEYLAQPQLFGDVSEGAMKLLGFFDRNKRSSSTIAKGLRQYASIASNEAGNHQKTMFDDSVRSKNSILDEAVRRAESGGDEIYHQGSARASQSGQTEEDRAASTQRHTRTLNIEHDGKSYTFTVENGEFTDKHPKHKKLFKRYLEVKDSDGRSVARYSTYGDKFSAAPGFKNASWIGALEKGFRSNLGRLLRTDSRDTGKRRTAKPTEQKSVFERIRDFVKGPEGDTRSFKERWDDTREERKAFNHARKQIQKKIEKALNDYYYYYEIDGSAK